MLPKTTPQPSPASIASGKGRPPLTHSTPIMADASPLIDPTDRSISPKTRTQTIPSEMIPTVAQSNNMFTRLFGAKNNGLSDVKTTEINTKPTATGSIPNSPERTRSLNRRSAPIRLSSLRTRSSARSKGGGSTARVMGGLMVSVMIVGMGGIA